ncbi:conserved hypothetical protein [Streptomyces clavuligerus]|nr:conserved hypothetical protein [Streptomyces clavuligerus]
MASGFNCTLALKVHTRRGGRLFLKGVRVSDTAGMDGLLWEQQLNKVVGDVGPTICHQFEAGGWLALAFIHIDGRHVDYAPGTGDLEAVTRTLRRMQHLGPPAVHVPQLSDRFDGPLTREEAAALHGTNLLHTDTNPHNVMIGRDGAAYVVDWAMPALGPAWVDVAYTARWLMAFGQPPEDAMAWLNGFTSWRQADRAAVETFVEVTCREATARLGEKDSAPTNARFRHLLGSP